MQNFMIILSQIYYIYANGLVECAVCIIKEGMQKLICRISMSFFNIFVYNHNFKLTLKQASLGIDFFVADSKELKYIWI